MCAAIFFCKARQKKRGLVAGTKGRIFPVTMKDLTCEAWTGERKAFRDSCAARKIPDPIALEFWKDSNSSEARRSSKSLGWTNVETSGEELG